MRYLAVVAMVVLAGCGAKEEAKEEKPKPLVAVKVVKAEVKELKVTVKAPAVVFPREQANISARVTAPIKTLKARKGDTVAANQVLAVLESRDVTASRQEATAAVTDAQANLQKMQTGTVPADVEKARGLVETSKAGLALAQKMYERRAELFKQGAIPNRDLQQTETELAQAKTNYEVAVKSLSLLQQKSGTKDVEIARSKVAQAQARLAGADVQVVYTELRSPFAGTITEQTQYPGDMAQPGVATFTVMDLVVVNARAQVPESELGKIKMGQACEFVSADRPDAPVGGRVTLINKAVDAQRRTVEVWCEIANGKGGLRANSFGDVLFQVGKWSGVTVPVAAVQFDEGARKGSVMVVDEKKLAHKREVEAGETLGGEVQIAKGLKAGETVIVEGGYGLPENAQVTLGGEEKK